MTVRVAINGFGRIGRNVLRAIIENNRSDISVVAINDLGPVKTNAHLLEFDSIHGKFPNKIDITEDSINVGTGPIKGFAVTLTIGIITSMFTAIIVSRAIINIIYGGKKVEELAI